MDARDPGNRLEARQETPLAASALAEWPIRDLVNVYPETMTVLGPLGIDLCCGGAHPLGEALDLHGLERDLVLSQVAGVVEASRAKGARLLRKAEVSGT